MQAQRLAGRSELVAMNYYGAIVGEDADSSWGACGTIKVGKYSLEY
jgi:hypothetical protein